MRISDEKRQLQEGGPSMERDTWKHVYGYDKPDVKDFNVGQPGFYGDES
jgi:hypothetical protein